MSWEFLSSQLQLILLGGQVNLYFFFLLNFIDQNEQQTPCRDAKFVRFNILSWDFSQIDLKLCMTFEPPELHILANIPHWAATLAPPCAHVCFKDKSPWIQGVVSLRLYCKISWDQNTNGTWFNKLPAATHSNIPTLLHSPWEKN